MIFEYTDEQKELMDKIAEYHRVNNYELQFYQAIQELAELQVEITKWKMGIPNYKEFLEEIFDADFLIYQLKQMMIDGTHDFNCWVKIVNAKIDREIRRHEL